MKFTHIALILLALAGANGCAAAGRIKNIGKAPDLSPTENPAALYGGRAIAMPMPAPNAEAANANSLWRAGSRTFFKDQRARRLGDIVTVVIDINDRARLNNTTERTRDNGETAQIPAFGGLEQTLVDILPSGANASQLVDLSSGSTVRGEGSVDRREDVELVVAAVVTDVLPNGNLVVAGKQEVRVNNEVRELTVTGVIRPEDISNANRINHTQIAEARISYGGRGQLTDVQQARYGQQLYDILFPF
ncbi:MAG TPA: flagellar basal body L-ring protein FlgH [Parvularculaceae bacterium]|nr:flagellar basal body L-ring protein FlgH [Parvularculaceae bacterium]